MDIQFLDCKTKDFELNLDVTTRFSSERSRIILVPWSEENSDLSSKFKSKKDAHIEDKKGSHSVEVGTFTFTSISVLAAWFASLDKNSGQVSVIP